MTLKTILVAASGGTASNGAVELACRLAQQFGAHVEGFHIRVDPRAVVAIAADGLGAPMVGGWIDQITAEAAELAKKTKAAFEAAAARHGLARAPAGKDSASASWREETGFAPLQVASRARFFDLTVLGRSERVVEQPHSDTVEETLLRSGRPVLLAPAKVPAVFGETIAVGWNGSPESVRALRSGLALLKRAKKVRLITVSEEDKSAAASAVEYLAWHGILAVHRNVPPVEGVGPGDQLLATARDEGADLLVMGGYGHGPWRELLFGGATRQIVGFSLLPVLMSH